MGRHGHGGGGGRHYGGGGGRHYGGGGGRYYGGGGGRHYGGGGGRHYGGNARQEGGGNNYRLPGYNANYRNDNRRDTGATYGNQQAYYGADRAVRYPRHEQSGELATYHPRRYRRDRAVANTGNNYTAQQRYTHTHQITPAQSPHALQRRREYQYRRFGGQHTPAAAARPTPDELQRRREYQYRRFGGQHTPAAAARHTPDELQRRREYQYRRFGGQHAQAAARPTPDELQRRREYQYRRFGGQASPGTPDASFQQRRYRRNREGSNNEGPRDERPRRQEREREPARACSPPGPPACPSDRDGPPAGSGNQLMDYLRSLAGPPDGPGPCSPGPSSPGDAHMQERPAPDPNRQEGEQDPQSSSGGAERVEYLFVATLGEDANTVAVGTTPNVDQYLAALKATYPEAMYEVYEDVPQDLSQQMLDEFIRTLCHTDGVRQIYDRIFSGDPVKIGDVCVELARGDEG